MAAPYGLAFSGVNGLLVSDVKLNRVLYFPMANGDLTSPQGETATKVFGQPDFNVGRETDRDRRYRHDRAAPRSGRHQRPALRGGHRQQPGNDLRRSPRSEHGQRRRSRGAHHLRPQCAARNLRQPLTGEIWVTDTGSSTDACGIPASNSIS
jgi:Ni/Co efflux regulator RcnB